MASNDLSDSSETEVEGDDNPMEKVLEDFSPSFPTSEPLHSPDAIHLQGFSNPFDSPSPSSTPHTPPSTSPLSRVIHNLPPVSLFDLTSPPFLTPTPLLSGNTITNLPAATPATIKRKKREKTLAEKKVQQLVEQKYGKLAVTGVKRKRSEHERKTLRTRTSQAISPPEYQAKIVHSDHTPSLNFPPSSPRLDPCDTLDEHPTWSLDDIYDALPIHNRDKGHGKAVQLAEDADPSETRSSIPTSNGICKIWYVNNGVLQHLAITQLEVRQNSKPSGHGTVVVATTASGAKLVDDLWMSSMNANASPFIEKSTMISAMRHQDPAIQSVVHFVPDPSRHPQYSFASHQDCWDFMQAVTRRKLCASIDLQSIQSNIMRGNSYETSDDTLQVWEGANRGSRTVKFFRNRNTSAASQMVEFDCNRLRAAEKERRTGKLVISLRDVRDGGAPKDIKYLKIAFSDNQAEEEFLHHVGISLQTVQAKRSHRKGLVSALIKQGDDRISTDS
jgi:hypothetical protein